MRGRSEPMAIVGRLLSDCADLLETGIAEARADICWSGTRLILLVVFHFWVLWANCFYCNEVRMSRIIRASRQSLQ